MSRGRGGLPGGRSSEDLFSSAVRNMTHLVALMQTTDKMATLVKIQAKLGSELTWEMIMAV